MAAAACARGPRMWEAIFQRVGGGEAMPGHRKGGRGCSPWRPKGRAGLSVFKESGVRGEAGRRRQSSNLKRPHRPRRLATSPWPRPPRLASAARALSHRHPPGECRARRPAPIWPRHSPLRRGRAPPRVSLEAAAHRRRLHRSNERSARSPPHHPPPPLTRDVEPATHPPPGGRRPAAGFRRCQAGWRAATDTSARQNQLRLPRR